VEYTPEMNRGGGEIKRENTFFFAGMRKKVIRVIIAPRGKIIKLIAIKKFEMKIH